MTGVRSGYLELKELTVDVIEPGSKPRRGAYVCELERHISFNTEILETFSSTNWQPFIYDSLVVAAAVEFCDRSLSRSSMNWGRRFHVHIPVHDPARWSEVTASRALVEALNFLTGDDWHFAFRARKSPAAKPAQNRMEFPSDGEAVIAYSEGMDSRAVAGLEAKRLGHRLVRVRVGMKQRDIRGKGRLTIPFAALPYEVKLERDNAENSARSRGFKFSLVAAIAAYMINAPYAIVPESGQGALAPAILPVAQGYADYRNHPAFTRLMEKFIYALFGYRLRYRFPRLWMTKGETLREFVDNCGNSADWVTTRSCWQKQRQVSVSKSWRQCGICAACMLRRLSVHAAGLDEPKENYVWETLKVPTFEAGVAEGFDRITEALREYAIAGVLHFEHFSSIRESPAYEMLKRRSAIELAHALTEPQDTVVNGLDRLLQQHGREWAAFMDDLGPESFVRQWIDTAS
ncbi:queuosine biosynthesis QueC family protein [Burkholderia pseudomallei]|uniref:Queuosine biosynthesis QueC family protein n=1 Tax=Burkholderia pseudomallei TaxID=28450 RepID=A0AA40JCU4_BURPE|nr:7-cyano-7-deazaguanine synthase [Burkholderia pseudomallei]KGX08171.1 queuosine biosynthesis QueC family protein [Burkholderia pseudomallei]